MNRRSFISRIGVALGVAAVVPKIPDLIEPVAPLYFTGIDFGTMPACRCSFVYYHGKYFLDTPMQVRIVC